MKVSATKSATSQIRKTLWASLEKKNDTADRHENRQKYFTAALDCLTNS